MECPIPENPSKPKISKFFVLALLQINFKIMITFDWILKYDETLSHSIYAASDMFIIPSIFEPCGLTQMIAMRYGSIPIVRKTGGLHDSVFDVDDDTIPLHFRNGFMFVTPDEQGVISALDRAFSHYRNKESWEQLVQKVMSLDFSWDISASQFEELYSIAVARERIASRS